MEEIIGFGALALVGVVAVLLSSECREIRGVMLVAYTVRAGTALLHEYILTLPDGGSDAKSFERIAWEWGNDGFVEAIKQFPGPDSYFYSWCVSLLYSIAGRSHLMAQSLSILAGIGSVYLVWILARELWGGYHAKKAAWVAALFPTLVLYSAMTMREPFVVFFLLLGLISLVQWVREGGSLVMARAMMGFFAATLFHGAMFIAILISGVFYVNRIGAGWLIALRRARLRVVTTIVLFGVFVCIVSFIVVGFDLPKLGGPQDLVDAGRYLHRMEYSHRGMASYPDWAVPSEESELVWKAPIRVIYFLIAPFSWDLEKVSHLVGWLDGFFYLIIVFCICRHWRAIWNKPEARAVALVLLALVFAFGVSVSNFGTGIRHRAKFVGIALALIAPRLPRLVMYRRSNTESVSKES